MSQLVKTVSPEEIKKLREHQPFIELIDVRAEIEFAGRHVPSSINVPFDELHPQSLMESRKENPVYIICKKGILSKKACQTIIDAGYSNAVNIAGGIDAWEQVGLPVVRNEKILSLEQQVKIAAGLMVLIGSILGFTLHTGFMVIPVFIGGGLVFSGILGTCGLGIALAKMPWNRSLQKVS